MMLTTRLLNLLLNRNLRELYSIVGTDTAQFVIPRDNKGVRLRVAVPAPFRKNVPAHASLAYEGETVDVPLELESNYEAIELH